MASLFTAARAFLSTHFTVTSHADPAVDYDGTRIMLFATMLQELVAPALIVHLAFIRVDSLVLQVCASSFAQGGPVPHRPPAPSLQLTSNLFVFLPPSPADGRGA